MILVGVLVLAAVLVVGAMLFLVGGQSEERPR